LSFLANADRAGLVLGVRVPVILTSRADSRRRVPGAATDLLMTAALPAVLQCAPGRCSAADPSVATGARGSQAMSEEQQKPKFILDADLEREIREGRKFTLAEAIGRLAGPGMMKGVSPATRKQQAEAAIETYLDRNLNTAAGALSVVLLRQVKQSELLLNNLDQPLVVLAAWVQRVLDSDYRLAELVRQADVEWGRVYGERPHFEREGAPAHEDDPYTAASVRGTLSQLLQKLAAAEHPS
jgi:hypothetical protein